MIYLSEIIDGKERKSEVKAPSFAKEFDVIVCGLGTAGSLAALFCAQNGLKVLGIEAFTCVGGTHTAGGVTGHYFGCRGGRYENLDLDVESFAKQYTCTTAESRKFLTEQALSRHGVEIVYEASVCGVYSQGNSVIGLKVITTNGIKDYKAKIVMDCTAEAYVAQIAGCETEFGRESDGQMQPYSLVSLIFDGKDYRYTNIDFGRVNQFDNAALSQAITFARSYKIKEANKGGTLIAQMPMMGMREGRRIKAEETVSLQELFSHSKTDTPMFYSYADLDKHGWDIAFDSVVMGDWAIGANLGAYNVTVAVPYKAILPVGIDSLLVPCRALGVDRDISSCVRMVPDMKKLAEAAAEWATLAIKQNKKLREVPYEQLRERLTKSGCLKESDNRGFRVDGFINPDGSPFVSRDVEWITDADKLQEQLKTERPGEAIWSAKIMGESAVPTLRTLLLSEDENTKKHAAFALAILGKNDGADILREMAAERDNFMLKDCRKNNNLRGCMAIYWLGRLQDKEIADELIGLICDENEINKAVYHQNNLQTTRYKIADFKDVYFQFVSNAVMALVRIGNMHVDLRPQISQAFLDAFSTDNYFHRITKRPKESSEGNMVLSIKNIAFSSIQKWKTKSEPTH